MAGTDTEERKTPGNPDEKGVKLKRQLGLVHGVAIVCGLMIGSGIYLGPSVVVRVSKLYFNINQCRQYSVKHY